MGPKFEVNETKRNNIKETKDLIEIDETDGLKDSKNLNEVTNEQIKKKSRKQGRCNIRMESRNRQKTCGRFNLVKNEKRKLTRN